MIARYAILGSLVDAIQKILRVQPDYKKETL